MPCITLPMLLNKYITDANKKLFFNIVYYNTTYKHKLYNVFIFKYFYIYHFFHTLTLIVDNYNKKFIVRCEYFKKNYFCFCCFIYCCYVLFL